MQNFFGLVRGAKCRPLACQAAMLTFRLRASPGMATVKTACNWEGGDTIAQLVTRDATFVSIYNIGVEGIANTTQMSFNSII